MPHEYGKGRSKNFTQEELMKHLLILKKRIKRRPYAKDLDTQWDGFPHAFYSGKMYNGHDVPTMVTAMGAMMNSVHKWADRVAGRGVLLDIAKYKGVTNLKTGYLITPADLDGAAKAQKVKVGSGDIVLIRTGWMPVLRKMAWPQRGNEPYTVGQPGIGIQACKWIKDKQVAAVAFDTLGGEVIPFDPEGVKKVNDWNHHISSIPNFIHFIRDLSQRFKTGPQKI